MATTAKGKRLELLITQTIYTEPHQQCQLTLAELKLCHTISSGRLAAERNNLVDLPGVDERADGGRIVGREQDLRLP